MTKNCATPWAKAGIHSINHFALAVPDLAESAKFMETFGLRVQQVGNELLVRASASEHVWLKVIQGDKLSFEFLSVGCYQEDFAQIERQVRDAGGILAEPHPAGTPDGIWFRDPDGTLVQLRIARKTMIDEKRAIPDASVPAGVQGAPFRSQAPKIAPTRLAHMLLYTPDVLRAVAFYEAALGVKVADQSRDIVAFTYARHGCDHHLIAFVKSSGRGINHSSWDLPSVEDLGLGQKQMRDAGYTRQWGVGRHVLGSNYFNYVRDTLGKWWEYNCHIDYIPAGMAWDGGDHDPEDALYLWGPDLPEGMLENNQ